VVKNHTHSCSFYKSLNLLIMSKKYYVVILIMGICFLGCTNQSNKLTEQKKLEIENQILNEWEKVCTTIENSDSEKYAFFISPDLIMMGSNGLVFYSKKDYIDNVRGWFSTRENTEIEKESIIVTVLSDKMALLDQESIFELTYKNESIQRVQHAVTLVFEKEPSGWMIVHGHESFKEIE